MNEVRRLLNTKKNLNFDTIAVSFIDFKNNSFDILTQTDTDLFFDLASLTKPLTLGSVYLNDKKIFSKEMSWLLNHKAGLKAWTRFSRDNWKSYLKELKLNLSENLYSDLSALRLMLEIEEVTKKPLKDLASFFWDEELIFWKSKKVKTPIYGRRNSKIIQGAVHDDNAYNLNCFTSHAGLFSTIAGLSKSLITLNKNTKMIETMIHDFKSFNREDRFLNGWDTASGSLSLAGQGASESTFGHLGFTGTSVWIDCEKQKGCVILSNACKNFWYERKQLNELRRAIGEICWKI